MFLYGNSFRQLFLFEKFGQVIHLTKKILDSKTKTYAMGWTNCRVRQMKNLMK